MKKYWIILLFCPLSWAANDELVILNWPDYLSKEVVSNFEKQYNVTVKQFYFDSSSDRSRHLFANKGKGFDITNISEHYLSYYFKKDWIMPLDKALLPNLKHIDPQYIKYQSNQLIAIPYHRGTIGIAYRKDLVNYPITSWKQILIPSEELKNKISSIKEGFDLTGIALKMLGYSANEIDPDALNQAQEILLKQKPFVKRYAIWVSTPAHGLLTGGEWIGINYSGDAASLHKENANVEYVYPEEGCLLWVDYWVILPSSQNKEVAYKFLNYLMKPENAAQNALDLNYATTNQTALKLLPKEHLDNPMIFPNENTIRNCEYLHTSDDLNALKSYNHLLIKLLQK
jgi:spermidine/putrescine transport system substrate-binding protein